MSTASKRVLPWVIEVRPVQRHSKQLVVVHRDTGVGHVWCLSQREAHEQVTLLNHFAALRWQRHHS